MKKKPGARTVNVFGRIFNVRTWVDFERMKSFTVYLAHGFRKMFVPQQREGGETFEEAIVRMNLSEKDLQGRQSALYRLSLLMCVAAIFIFAYGMYHLYYGGYRATIISLAVMLIALSLAFRYHFWYFQIKERKLGCTLQEWYRKGLMGGK
jgi:intracellular multiplication protein IcmV